MQPSVLFAAHHSFELHGYPVRELLLSRSDFSSQDGTFRFTGQVLSIGAVIRIEQRVRDLTGRLLAQESAIQEMNEAGGTRTFRVCEGLRVPLSSLSGQAGYQALLSRALNLAKAESPRLATLQVDAATGLKGVDTVVPSFSLEEARAAELALVAHLLQLLCVFVGEALTLRLVQGVWPGAAFDEGAAGKEETR